MLFCNKHFWEDKSIKKSLNILLVVISLAILMMASIYFVLQMKYVQQIIIKKISVEISKQIDADVSIGSVNIALFKKIVLTDFYLSDQNKDTLVYSPKMVASIDTLSLKKKILHLKHIELVQPVLLVKKLDGNKHNFSFLFTKPIERKDSDWKFGSSSFKIKSGRFLYAADSLKKEIGELSKLDQVDLTIDKFIFSSSKDFSFELKRFKTLSANGLEIKKGRSTFNYSDSIVHLRNVEFQTQSSTIVVDSLIIGMNKFVNTRNFWDLLVNASVNTINISSKDAALLYPEYDMSDLNLSISGYFYGKLEDIKGKNVQLSLGNITNINGDFALNGLSDLENTFIFVNLLESYANLYQLRKLELPEQLKKIVNSFPSQFNNIGIFRYRGNFTGFINDFVAYGTAYSNLGSIESDISFKPGKNNSVKIDGHLKTKSLHLGSIFNVRNVGKLSLNGAINGTILKSNYNFTFSGTIDTIDINQYRFQNIGVIGNIKNKLFDGYIDIDDPNLKLNFAGNLNLEPELPIFKFDAKIERADLYKLNITTDTISIVSFATSANFVGNNIDNSQGEISFENLKFRNSFDSVQIQNAWIKTNSTVNNSFVSILSDFADVEISGQYSLLNITSSLKRFIGYYIPSYLKPEFKNLLDEDNFTFDINVKDITPLSRLVMPNLVMDSPFKIKGNYNTADQKAYISTVIPDISYFSRKANDITLNITANRDKIEASVHSSELNIDKEVTMTNVSLHAEAFNDMLFLDLDWKKSNGNNFSGNIQTFAGFYPSTKALPIIGLEIKPSIINISDSIWNISARKVIIDSSSITFDQFTFVNKDRNILLNGTISKNPTSNFYAHIKNIEFKLFEPLIGKSGFDGIINGNIEVADLFNKMKLNMNISIEKFTFKKSLLGDMLLTSNWHNEKEVLITNITIKESSNTILAANGHIDPKNRRLDLNLGFNNTPLHVLETFVPSIFYENSGFVSGSVHLHGPLKHIKHDGVLTPETRGRLGVKFLKTNYFFSESVIFKSDSIIFPSLKIEDPFNNTGIVDGFIKHRTFSNMIYNISISSEKIFALNTTEADYDKFFGTAFGSGYFTITGKGTDVQLNGNIRSEKGTTFNIPMERKGEAAQYDFIQFAKTGKTEVVEPIFEQVSEGINMNFDIEVTPDAKVQIIFNSQAGDIIRGEGTGNLQVRVDKNNKLKLYGDYVIEKGDYLFTLQNIVNKRFSINRGGTIKWTGDPYDASLDLTAVYKLKTSVLDLFPGTYQDADLVRRLPVDCIILLTESLKRPLIDFKIELPTAEDRIKDEVNRLIVTKEDVNKQMISLLLMGRFYTPEFFSGRPTTETGTQLMGATASELLSNQLTNWLSQISDVVDIGVNYRPGNDITDDQIELALSYQILDDRITIDGNIANNSNPSSKNNGDFIGDFDLKIKLTNDGRLQFKAFHHSNDNLIWETSPYTQGIGFSYREEFDTAYELWKRYTDAIFGRNDKIVPSNLMIE
jgi:hypothetical protein